MDCPPKGNHSAYGRAAVTTPGEVPDHHSVVDGRGLEPPEPMVRVLEALDLLPPGERMLFLIDREPRPLFRILKQNGYDYRCEHAPEGFFRVSIWKSSDPPAATPPGLSNGDP